MKFLHIEAFFLFIIPLILLILVKTKKVDFEKFFKKDILVKMQKGSSGLSKKVRAYLLIASLSFLIIAIARPVINNGEIKVKSEFIDLVTAFDISKSMLATDIYPNRLEFSKDKFFEFLDYFKKGRVGVIGFSSRAFLISPLTSDYTTLKYLVKNMSLDYVSLKGTNLLEPLIITNKLLKNSKQKALLIFSDGGDKSDFSKEIEYAKEHNIKVFVYAVATNKGSVIKDKNGVLKDKNGNIVITRLNEKIKDLALKSGGAYMQYSLRKDDMKILAKEIEKKLKVNRVNEKIIKDIKELFYYPLLISIILFFIANFSLPSRRG